MKFNKSLLIVALVSINALCFGSDIRDLAERFGLQNNNIDKESTKAVLVYASSGMFSLEPDALAASSIIRAQFTKIGDSTLNGLGQGDAFARLFNNNQHAAYLLKELVGINPSLDRSKIIGELNTILDSSDAAAGGAGGGFVTTGSVAAVSGGVDRSRFGKNYDKWLNDKLVSWGLTPTGDLATDANMANSGGATPLINASVQDLHDVVEFLLQAGADKNARLEGKTAEDYAAGSATKAVIAKY